MHVQAIQTTNNSPKTNFTAKFVYDNKGLLTKLVSRRPKNYVERETLDTFRKMGKGQKLEILEWDDTPYACLAADPTQLFNDFIIFNRSNGKTLSIKRVNAGDVLGDLLKKIIANKSFFKDDTMHSAVISRIVEP